MIKIKKAAVLFFIMVAVVLFITTGCDKDNSSAQTTTYEMKGKDVLGVTGTVTITETSNTSATIDIALANAPSGIHPAALYMLTTAEEGAIAVALNPVDATGKSSTVVSNLNYSQLISYDGSIKVLKSVLEPEVIIAQADIGGNVITDTNKTYTMSTVGVFGVSGTALFQQRKNNNTLVTISLTGVIPGEFYPASINLGSVSTVGGGTVAKLLNSVNGTTGKSFTNIRKLDSDLNITYDNWLVYSGYLNVYQTSVNLGNIISQGNIGSN
jgi:hypothetical protein